MWRDVVLWLFVINLGIALGAGLYEHRVVISQWTGVPPREWPNTGRLFWAYVTTGPLTLLTLTGIFSAWTAPEPMRTWYLASVIIVLVERIATFAFFIPTMLRLATMDPGPQVSSGLKRWLMLNHGRNLLSLAGWLAALRALSLLEA
jgi:hypothetical protein